MNLRISCKLVIMSIVGLLTLTPCFAQLSSTQRMVLPAYIYPDCVYNPKCLFDRVEYAIPPIGILIINPYNGPGQKFDANYLRQVQRLQAKGAAVLGYVTTSYAKVSLQSAQQQINNYYNWYHVDGIFFDEAYGKDCAKFSYYATLNLFVKSKGGKAVTVVNYGADIPECYINASDIVVNFEAYYAQYAKWVPTAWYKKYPAKRFMHIIHTTPYANINDAIWLSRQRNADWVYVTDGTMPAPFNTLPNLTYWNLELGIMNA